MKHEYYSMKQVARCIAVMYSILLGHARPSRGIGANRTVGISANQLGYQYRIFAFNAGFGKIGVAINPSIYKNDSDTITVSEGCLSSPNIQVKVTRPASIILTGQDESMKPFTFKASGLLAAIIQHEMDHLDGKHWPPQNHLGLQ